MEDMREMVVGRNRVAIEDDHTARTYELYRERSKAINSLLYLAYLASIVVLVTMTVISIAFVVWAWRVLV